jgi:hypothetical protein
MRPVQGSSQSGTPALQPLSESAAFAGAFGWQLVAFADVKNMQ